MAHATTATDASTAYAGTGTGSPAGNHARTSAQVRAAPPATPTGTASATRSSGSLSASSQVRRRSAPRSEARARSGTAQLARCRGQAAEQGEGDQDQRHHGRGHREQRRAPLALDVGDDAVEVVVRDLGSGAHLELLGRRVRGGALGQHRQVGGVEVGRHLDAAVDPDEEQLGDSPAS